MFRFQNTDSLPDYENTTQYVLSCRSYFLLFLMHNSLEQLSAFLTYKYV